MGNAFMERVALMNYKDFKDSKYPTEQEDKLLHILYKAGTLSNSALAKKMKITHEEVQALLESLIKKGLVNHHDAQINKQCTRDHWILIECFEPLLELASEGFLILNMRPGKGVVKAMRVWAQENMWAEPTQAEKDLKLKFLIMHGYIVRTEKGMNRAKQGNEKRDEERS